MLIDYYNQMINEQARVNMEIYSYDAPHPIQFGIRALIHLLNTLESN